MNFDTASWFEGSSIKQKPKKHFIQLHAWLILSCIMYIFLVLLEYRKRPCISRTFFHKIEAKNRGCGLSMDTSVFGVLKSRINIHKTS